MSEKQSIVLAMIVKDESHIIASCLNMVRGFIDSWCIVDTGSSDDTIEIIKDTLKDTPGELHEKEWVDFAYNRTECFNLAKLHGTYVLVLDADDRWICNENFEWPRLTFDGYTITLKGMNITWKRIQLLSSRSGWTYGDPVHAVPFLQGAVISHLDGPIINPEATGRRHIENPIKKYLHDVDVYINALSSDPMNTRYRFYLAESYRYGGMEEEALLCYMARSEMGGFWQEAWYSLYQAGKIYLHIGEEEKGVHTLMKAWSINQSRAEPLHVLSLFLINKKEYRLAGIFSEIAKSCKPNPNGLFVEYEVYEWRAIDTYALASYYIGNYWESIRAYDELLSKAPASENNRILDNIKFCKSKLPAVSTSDLEADTIDVKIIIAGCGRSGTGFLSEVLRKAGIRSGHEYVFSPIAKPEPCWGDMVVDSSWLAIPWLSSVNDNVRIVHIVRNPIDNARSWLGVGMFDDDPDKRHLPYIDVINRFSPGIMCRKNPIERWLAYWVVWNEYILTKSEKLFRIEDLDENCGLGLGEFLSSYNIASTVDQIVSSYSNVSKSFNRRIIKHSLKIEDILKCDISMVKRFKILCIKFGYDIRGM